MKPQRIASLLSLATVVTGCSYTTVDPAPPPPSADQIVGAWYGLSSFRAYRLELFPDATGTLMTTDGPQHQKVTKYSTDQWRLVGNELCATFVPIDTGGDPVYFKASANNAWNVSLTYISISLSNQNRVPAAEEFLRESQIRESLDFLNSSPSN